MIFFTTCGLRLALRSCSDGPRFCFMVRPFLSLIENDSTSPMIRTPTRFCRIALCLLASVLFMPAVAEAAVLRDVSATGWQLVQIVSMNDTVSTPEEGGRYRLVFGIDGSVAVEAACNRASGRLAVFDPPRLQFTDLAATRAMCAPGALSERFLTELGWVRSYVYRNGLLHLATMADGSIIEFAPLPPAEAIATVGSLSLFTEDVDALRGIILSRLLDDYALEHDITVDEREIDAYRARMDKQLREDLGENYDDGASLSAEERAEVDRMRTTMAESVIRNWKVNAALHQQYGGRVIYQQLGPEPLDAYLALLRDAHAANRFAINQPELEQAFWSFFTDDQRHSFVSPDSEDEARAFTTPPWAQGR